MALTNHKLPHDDVTQITLRKPRTQLWYCASLTFSIQSTALPSSASWMAMWVMAVVGAAPCQCFSPGAKT